MELSAMGGRRLTSQQIQQLQQAHQHQQQQIQQLQQLQQYQQQQHQQLQQQQQNQAMLFQQQHQQHSMQQIPPPPMMGGGGNPLHRSAQRFSVSRHRKDSLGKSVSKYMYPPGSPSMGFNENIYHPQNTTTATANANSNTANSKHNRYPEPDPDIIEVYLEDDPIKLKEAVRDGKEIKWRNNIVATMERYDPGPISAATLPSSYLQQHHQSSTDSSLNPEYSYAYCEPMILKQQSLQQQQQQQQLTSQPGQLHPNSLPQIHKLSASASSNALSKLPSTNSLRALLSKSFRKSSLSNAAGSSTVSPGAPGGVIPEKHTFTTRYGTKENIYEDVGAGSNLGTAVSGAKPVAGATNSTSMQSFESINKFNLQDELRLVQSHHDRILGELNLSVETLIMPSKDEQDAIEERLNEIHCAQYHDEMSQDDCIAAGSSNSAMIHMQERLSPTTSQPNSGDVDSGISGSSSSGASYSSSMLYRTTAMYTNNSKTVTINDNAEGSGSGMSMLAGSSSIRSSCGSSSGCSAVPVAYSSCGGASCSKMASNIVIPNSNKLACCFYSDKLSKTSKSNSDHLDTLSDKSSFWNKLGKLKISGVFGGANNSNSSSGSSASHSHLHNQHFHPPHHHHHPHHLHHHHNHTLPSHLHQLQGLNHSIPTTTTNTATIARSNESEPHIHLHHHRLPSPLVTTTIEPWWQTPSDLCLMDPSSCGEYQLPCEVLVPPPQPPPSLSSIISGVSMRPPLPQPPLQTQIELEEDEEEQKAEEGAQ